jgi:siroheme synthase
MPGGHEADLARQLVDAGISPDTACFIVASASRSDEQVVSTTLGELPHLEKRPAPSLLLIGVMPPKAWALKSAARISWEHGGNH